MANSNQRSVQQPALQVPPGSAVVTKELQVSIFSKFSKLLSGRRDGWSRWTTTQCSPPIVSRCSSTSWRWRRRRALRWRRRSSASTRRILFLGLRIRNHIGCPIKKIPNVPYLEPSLQYTLINQGGLWWGVVGHAPKVSQTSFLFSKKMFKRDVECLSNVQMSSQTKTISLSWLFQFPADIVFIFPWEQQLLQSITMRF